MQPLAQAHNVQGVCRIDIDCTLPEDGAILSMVVLCSVLNLVFTQTLPPLLPLCKCDTKQSVKKFEFHTSKFGTTVLTFRHQHCVCVEKLNQKLSKKIKTVVGCGAFSSGTCHSHAIGRGGCGASPSGTRCSRAISRGRQGASSSGTRRGRAIWWGGAKLKIVGETVVGRGVSGRR